MMSAIADARITGYRHWLVRMPFDEMTEGATNRRAAATRLVVRLETDAGIVGWGETICLLDSIEPVLAKVVLPIALGMSVSDTEKLHRHVLGAGYYHHKRAAVMATVAIQRALSEAQDADHPALRLRCGLHAGADMQRDGDFYGPAVNRAARITGAAHGGQMLLSQAVADHVRNRLPDSVSLRDLGIVRLRDLSNPEHVYQVQHAQLRAEFPALRSLEGTPNNLTQQLNSFIGRERELAEVRQMLASNRLVTLLGMGGIGKSRLSMQLAADVLDDFPDGVWFVELAALTDPGAVPQAVASVLGVKEEAGRPVIEALTRHVRDLQLLIILDNCEQVVQGCAELAKRLLQAGSRTKVMASSRDYLQVAGEASYQVPTLSVPGRQIPLEALARHEAVRLFIDRAVASSRGFGLTEQNAAAVADICYCLDGIPLAIELAAARVRSLSVQSIAARLNDRFKLLITGDQTVLPRQRTLRALIDWSYDLLNDAERSLFQRLSVFAGGWTLEAAEAVCVDEHLRAEDVVDLLTRLVEKSLVIMELSGERYRMLDTVRHYAQQKLDEAGDASAVHGRHLDFYLAFAEKARAEFGGPAHEAALARLDLEKENLLSAHGWIGDARNLGEFGLRLASALKGYWIGRGLMGVGLQVTQEALARVADDRRDYARSRALFDAGQLCCFMGQYSNARGYLERSLAIARELGDTTMIALAFPPLGMAAIGLGDRVAARAYFEQSIELARALGKKRELAVALTSLAQFHRMEQMHAVAEPLYKEALALARELGDQNLVAIALLNLAMVNIERNDAAQVPRMLNEAIDIATRVGLRPVGQSALDVVAGLCAKMGDWSGAARFCGAAQAQAQRAGLPRDAVDEAFLSPLIANSRSALLERFDQTVGEGKASSYEENLHLARLKVVELAAGKFR